MKREKLSARERVNLALAHQETDRIPMAMVCAGINPPARQALAKYLQQTRGIGVEEYLKSFLDIRMVSPAYRGPSLPEGTDIWGVVRQPVANSLDSYEEIVCHPLKEFQTIDQLQNYPWPRKEFFDYQVIGEQLAALDRTGNWAVMIANGNIFETAWYLRGFQQLLLDFMVNPELADYLLSRVADFMVAHFQAILEAGRGRIDLAFTADDLAGQQGLLVSPSLWARYIRPHHLRLNNVIHHYGARVIYHSDGAVIELVPELMEIGMDVLQSLQLDARGMDPVELKTRFGQRLSFQGGVSVQKTLPFGSSEEVRQEVERLITVLGKG
ncbi:MAG TPA: uroporphyrinogen decarboxylase family protein, partial [bacterium]|nr:uroporphyrinogen decarboxylase family protein [bacterium]